MFQMPWDIARQRRQQQLGGQQDDPYTIQGPPREPTPQTQDQARLDALEVQSRQLDIQKKQQELQSGGLGIAPRGDASKVGEDYLKSLPADAAADAPMLRAMSEGRMGLPSGYAMRSPKALQLLAELHQYDPTADAANLPGRVASYKNATSGMLSRKINSYNTALDHMQSLAAAVEDLHNFGGSTPLTSVANYARNAAENNRPELSRFETARKAVADELAKAFADTNTGMADRTDWKAMFSENKSPKALRAAIAQAATLLGSKITESERQYNGGMGTTGQRLPLLNPHAQEALGLFQGQDYLDKGFGAIAGPLGGPGPGGGGHPPGGGGAPPQPYDPAGIGDIGFNQSSRGLPPGAEAAQRDIQAQILAGKLRGAGDIMGYAKTKYGLDINPAQAKAAADAIANGVMPVVATPQYRDKMDEAARKQALIDSQNISDVRGGRTGEALGAGLRGAANMASWGIANKAAAGLDALTGKRPYNQGLARQDAIDQYDAQHHFLPQLTGSALGLMGNEAGVGRAATGLASRSASLARMSAAIPARISPELMNDAAYGTVYGAVNTDGGPGDRALGAIEGAGTTALGGAVGRAVGRGLGRTLTGSRDLATQTLAKAGVPMTIGQIAGRGGAVGRTLKAAEDAFESIPILGAAIRARRQEGLAAYNQGTFDRALEPIAQTTQGQIAEQGVDNSRTALSGAYQKALAGVNVTVQDPVFAKNLARVIGNGQRLHPAVGGDFQQLIQNQLAPVIAKGNITGDEFQALQQVIRQERSDWASQPRGRQYGNVLTQLDKTLESLVRRQAPQVGPALNAANRAYRLSKVAEDAVGRAANTDGVFTPAQLGMAARKNGARFDNTAATTDRPFYDYQRAGQQVLPSKIGNSGTFDRAAYGALVPTALGGAAYEMDMTPEHSAAMIALGIPFTKAGQAAFQKLLIERPDYVRNIGQNLIKRPGARRLFGSAGVFGAGPAISGLLSDN